MGKFADQVRKFSEDAKARLDAVTRESVLEAGRRLIDRSPIDSGAFVSNWNYSLEAPDYSTTGATTIRTVNHLGELPKAAGGFIHYISNGTAYGGVIERGGYPNPPKKGRGRTINGFSTQAPQGVVALTALEWSQIVAQSVERVVVRRAFDGAVADARAEGIL
jgi:hypothetical protein